MKCHELPPQQLKWLRLHLTPGLGQRRLSNLYQAFGSVDEILAADPVTLYRRARLPKNIALAIPPADCTNLLRTAGELAANGVRLVCRGDDEYPDLLKAIHDPPVLLYVRGRFPLPEGLAVVGSRRASPDNMRLVRDICRELAACDILIISGLARGIDTAAHLGALDADGWTAAVLGCGIDRIYPLENSRLFHKIAAEGTLISEQPPGMPPKAGNFPSRNRIVSGLSRGVLVAEAAMRSGSLITADFALEQGREVFALPGPVQRPSCAGTNALLKDGAHLVTEARDIIEMLWRENYHPPPPEPLQDADEGLSETDRKVARQLGSTPLHIDEIVRKSGLTPMEVSAILLHLELQGSVVQLPGMRYQRA